MIRIYGIERSDLEFSPGSFTTPDLYNPIMPAKGITQVSTNVIAIVVHSTLEGSTTSIERNDASIIA